MAARILSVSDSGAKASPSLKEALGLSGASARLLFIAPHDDDALIGAGLMIAQAASEGLDVHIAIITDGSQGYCELEDKDRICEIRRRETVNGYAKLGVSKDRLHFLGFPDGQLYQWIGRRPAQPGDPAIEGSTGLENSLTHLLRRLAPACVLTPASTDLHPDHQATHRSLLVSLFHASGDIWPELGRPCAVPAVYEFPIYIRMDAPPTLMLEVDQADFDRKLQAIGCYVSQRQIETLVEGIRAAGPVEFLRNLQFEFYQPSDYIPLFKKPS